MAIILLPVQASGQARGPIRIVGDSGFTEENGVSGGSGTPWDPYVIEGLTIRADLGDAVTIEKTTKFFVLRNCSIYARAGSAIRLVDALNGVIEDVSLKASHGIVLERSYYTSISGVEGEVDHYMIYAIHSSNISISGVSGSTGLGVRISSSENITLEGLDISGSENEVVAEYSRNVTFRDMRVSSGLYVYHTQGVYMSDALAAANITLISTYLEAEDCSFRAALRMLGDVAVLRNIDFRNASLSLTGTTLWAENASIEDSSISASNSHIEIIGLDSRGLDLGAIFTSVHLEDSRISFGSLSLSNASFAIFLNTALSDVRVTLTSPWSMLARGLNCTNCSLSVVEGTDVLIEDSEFLLSQIMFSGGFNITLYGSASRETKIDLVGASLVQIIDFSGRGTSLNVKASWVGIDDSSFSYPGIALSLEGNHAYVRDSKFSSSISTPVRISGNDITFEDSVFHGADYGFVAEDVKGLSLRFSYLIGHQGLAISDAMFVNITFNVIYTRGSPLKAGMELSRFSLNSVYGPIRGSVLYGSVNLTLNGYGNYWDEAAKELEDRDGDGFLDRPVRVGELEDTRPLAEPPSTWMLYLPLADVESVSEGERVYVSGNYTLIRANGVAYRTSGPDRWLPGKYVVESWAPSRSPDRDVVIVKPYVGGAYAWSPLWILVPISVAIRRRLSGPGGTSRSPRRGRR